MKKAKIEEYCINKDGSMGYISNPIRGRCPMDCDYCYSIKEWNKYHSDSRIYFERKEVDAWDKIKTPSTFVVFPNIEAFDRWSLVIWFKLIFMSMNRNPQHTFIVMTRKPQSMCRIQRFPENCWIGASIDGKDGNGEEQLRTALNSLRSVRASVKFICFEPLLGDIFDHSSDLFDEVVELYGQVINWCIIGSQIRPVKLPELSNVTSIIDISKMSGIPIFCKSNLDKLFKANELEQYRNLRQMPKGHLENQSE